MSLTRHIRKGVLKTEYCVTFIYSGWLPAIPQRIEKKQQRRIMFERNYFFFHHWLLSCRGVLFQKQYFV